MDVPTLFLPTHVYARAVEDQAVFLDLKRNEYLSTTLRELQGLSRFVHEWPRELQTGEVGKDAERAVEALTRNQLLYAKPSRTRKADISLSLPARRTLLEYSPTRYPPALRYMLSFLKAALIAKYFLSVRSLYATVNRIQRRQARNAVSPQPYDLQTTRQLVEAFKRLRPLLPPTRTPCLVNSVVLLEFLAAHGQFPRLVFGVQVHPFSAHCWVQHADIVLNSTLEDVLKFTPIMVA
jgi:Transglutaminase-like superfamily